MQDSTTSKEKILKLIRKALINKSTREVGDVDIDSEIFTSSEEPLEIQFAQNFLSLNGKFIFCENEREFIENLDLIIKDSKWDKLFCLEPSIKEMLNKGSIVFSDNTSDFIETNIGITLCESLIARTGSVMLTSKQASGRRLPIYANIHVVLAYTSQLVYNVKDAFKKVHEKYGKALPSMITTISGPSRTADIEKTLVQGAHGPKEVFVFLIDDTIAVD